MMSDNRLDCPEVTLYTQNLSRHLDDIQEERSGDRYTGAFQPKPAIQGRGNSPMN